MQKGQIKDLTPKEIDEMQEIYTRIFQGETIVGVCKDMGIDRRSYYRRKKHPQWIELEKMLNEKLIDNAYEEIMKTVILEAKKGSQAHAKLFMDVTGRLKSTREVREDRERQRLQGSTTPLDLSELKRLVEEEKHIRLIK
ncbi:phBC6A51 family helix-turn-helix protein [Metabacillus sp. FJAT-52054]|uniref:PhBC6A51 family helix-turn-helix protein n=1 Tax=Metabacillus sediminis TaxID=3117746 RepID=A0ABZ2NHV2_9BACI